MGTSRVGLGEEYMTTFFFYEWYLLGQPRIISGGTPHEAYKNLKAIHPINRGLLVPTNQVHHMGTYDEGSYFNPPV